MNDLTNLARIFPPTIRTIAVVAPSSPSDHPDGTTRLLGELERAGLDVRLAENARLGEPGDAYSAIDAKLRAQDLEKAWLDPDVQLILPIRGGGGGRELIEALDWGRLARRPDRVVLGYSDLTLLHSAMIARSCGRPVTAPMLEEIPSVTPGAIDATRLALAGAPHGPYKLKPIRGGRAYGPLLGAHLQRLASLLGTPWFADLDGRILFLECPHRSEDEIIPIFRRLSGSGRLDTVAAIVFGRFPGCTSAESEAGLLRELGAFVRCPVFAGFPFGHTPALHAIDSAAHGSLAPDGTLEIEPGPPIAPCPPRG